MSPAISHNIATYIFVKFHHYDFIWSLDDDQFDWVNFAPDCMAAIQCMKLQEKEECKDEKYIGNLVRKKQV